MSHLPTPSGVRLRVSDRGAGPAIVLVHGWKGSHRLWDPVVARLEASHRVVAFDLRGMGESDKPRGAYDFDEFADDLEFVLATLELRDVLLVGWSMGTTVALRYLDRGSTRVSGLVIVNGPLRLTRAPDFPHTMTEAELDGHLTRLRDRWPAGEREFQAQTVLRPDPALVDWLYGIALQTPLDVALRVVREQAKLDMREALARVQVPVLAAYSRHDPYYPVSLADDIAWRARDGQKVIFDQSAHCIPIEEPDRFCEVLKAFAAEAVRNAARPAGEPRTRDVEHTHVRLAHGQLAVARAGAGPAVVLLHQTPRSWDEYRDVLPRLAARGYQAIALDTAGFGDSASVSGPPSIEAWAAAANAALDGLGIERAAIVGHHTGGVIAVELAHQRPDRVATLILSSTPLTDAAYRATPPDESGVDDAQDAEGLRRSRAGFYPRHRPELLDRYVADALRAGALARRGHHVVGSYAMDGKLDGFEMPVLLIGADQDPYAYPQLERMRRALPTAEVAVIRGGMVPLPDGWPEEFEALVADFLARTGFLSSAC